MQTGYSISPVTFILVVTNGNIMVGVQYFITLKFQYNISHL